MPKQATTKGKKRLSRLVQQAMERLEIKGGHRGLAKFIREQSEMDFPDSSAYTLIIGSYRQVTIDFIYPIVLSKLLLHADGNPYTIEDVVDVVFERKDPFCKCSALADTLDDE